MNGSWAQLAPTSHVLVVFSAHVDNRCTFLPHLFHSLPEASTSIKQCPPVMPDDRPEQYTTRYGVRPLQDAEDQEQAHDAHPASWYSMLDR